MPGRSAFPAGASSRTTPTPWPPRCARPRKRSACRATQVEVIGQLPHYTTVTRFVVTPVVALVQPPLRRWQLDAFEVAEAFEVPLAS